MNQIARWSWLWLIAACSSAIEVVEPAGALAPAGPSSSVAPASDGAQGPVLRRLTVRQYQNSLVELFGDSIERPTELEADTVLHGFASIGAAQIAFSPRAIELLEDAALKVAGQALSDAATRTRRVGCTPSGAAGDACVREFLRRFGRRVWRRPLTEMEVQRYATLGDTAAAELKDAWAGLGYSVAGLLQSPYFLYRVELGTVDPSDRTRRAFDGFELATRLSFLLWNSTPDEALLDAAQAGLLATREGLRAQAERLLLAPQAHAALANFWSEWLRLSELDTLPQSVATFPRATAGLGQAMRGETLRVLEDAVFVRDRDFRDLFSNRETFVNAELAELYGLTGISGTELVPVSLGADSPRAGLLGQASFLALNAHATSTSPTRRGKFVREALLCEAVPAPPPNVSTELPQDATDAPRTMRQKLEQHRSNPQCASCHAAMDPIGLGFEHFDAIGTYRSDERGLAIDASGALDGVPFADAAELGRALGAHPGLAPCLVRSMLRYATGRLESAAQQSAIDDLSASFAGEDYRVRALLLAIVESDTFRRVGALE